MVDARGAMAANDLRVGMIVRVVRGSISRDGREDRSWRGEMARTAPTMKIRQISLPVVTVDFLEPEDLRHNGHTFDVDHGWGFRLVTPDECPIAASECPLTAKPQPKCPLLR